MVIQENKKHVLMVLAQNKIPNTNSIAVKERAEITKEESTASMTKSDPSPFILTKIGQQQGCIYLQKIKGASRSLYSVVLASKSRILT